MSFAAIWDRAFWSLLLFFLVTFLWLRFVDDALPYSPTGFLVSALAAALNISWWWRQQRRALRTSSAPREGK